MTALASASDARVMCPECQGEGGHFERLDPWCEIPVACFACEAWGYMAPVWLDLAEGYEGPEDSGVPYAERFSAEAERVMAAR